MSKVRDQLRRALAQHSWAGKRPFPPAEAAAREAFRPVREAAEELRDELSKLPDVHFEISDGGVWIDLYDKHVCFSYDAEEGLYLGTEQDTKWMEGGVR